MLKRKLGLLPPNHMRMNRVGAGRSWQELWPDSAGELGPSVRQRQLIFTTPYQRIYRVTAKFDDFTKEYFVNEHGPRAGVVVVRQDQVLLVQRYRLLIDRVSWEIPGGRVNDGETPQAAAVRECLEETGVRCFNLQPLVDSFSIVALLAYHTLRARQTQSIELATNP